MSTIYSITATLFVFSVILLKVTVSYSSKWPLDGKKWGQGALIESFYLCIHSILAGDRGGEGRENSLLCVFVLSFLSFLPFPVPLSLPITIA